MADKLERTRATKIFTILKELYPKVHTALENWDGIEWKFLFCVILSAQTTDVQVNRVTKRLFGEYPSLESFASSSTEDISTMIRSIGFYNVKAKYLKKTATLLINEYGGVVPKVNEELMKLPGVGRKVANVFTGVICKENQGIAVDTHVMRLSRRLGLTKQSNPIIIEKDLQKLYPNKVNWDEISLLLIEHGRKTCTARRPKCDMCELESICPKLI